MWKQMPELTAPAWTQDQAIAFECAREVITDMMAICTGRIAEEAAKERPNDRLITELRTDRSKLAQERASLHVSADEDVARIRSEYGAFVRAWRSERQATAI